MRCEAADNEKAGMLAPLPGTPAANSLGISVAASAACSEPEQDATKNVDSRQSEATLAWQKNVRGSLNGVLTVENGTTLTFDEAVSARRMITERQRKAQARMKLLPGSWSLSVWRSVMVAITAWTVVVAPLEIAFSWWESPDWLSAIGTSVDVLFVLDMVLNFNVAFMHHGRLVTDHRHIAEHYVRSWFIPDLLINIPWNLMMDGSNGKSRKVAKVLKLPKIFRLTRLFRVAREEAQYFGTAFAILGLVLLAHYCACMWGLLLVDCGETRQCPSMFGAYIEAFSVGVATLGGSDGWMRFVLRGQHAELSGQEQDWRASPFDWAASGAWAEIAASASCLGGFVVLGMLFSTISKAMERSDAHTRLFHERLWNLTAVMQRHDVDDHLLQRTRRHYHYLWSCGSDASRAILQDNALSADLRRQFAFAFYGGLLRQVPFLGSAHQSFIKQLCASVEVEVFSPMDRIIVAGEANTELYFIAVGRVAIEMPGLGEVLKVLDEGSFFGEMGLLFPESRRTVDVVGQVPGWLLVVPRSALESLCTEELLEAFRAVALERLAQFRTRGVRLSDVPEGAEFFTESSEDEARSCDNHSRSSSSGCDDFSRRSSMNGMLAPTAGASSKRASCASMQSGTSALTHTTRLEIPVQSSVSATPSMASTEAAAAVAAASATWRIANVRRASQAVGFNNPRPRMSVLSVNPALATRMDQRRKSPNMAEATKASVDTKVSAERHHAKTSYEEREMKDETSDASSVALVDKLAAKVHDLVTSSLAPLAARLGAVESRLANMEASLSPVGLPPAMPVLGSRLSEAARTQSAIRSSDYVANDVSDESFGGVLGSASSSEPPPTRPTPQKLLP